MDTNNLFSISNLVALIFWLPLIVFPYHRRTEKYVKLYIGPVFFALCYIGFLIITFVENGPISFDSIDDIKTIFSSDWGVLTGWVHYLCFDLMVGSLLLLRCKEVKASRWGVVPGLIFCFMLGPIGFLILYLLIRAKKPK